MADNDNTLTNSGEPADSVTKEVDDTEDSSVKTEEIAPEIATDDAAKDAPIDDAAEPLNDGTLDRPDTVEGGHADQEEVSKGNKDEITDAVQDDAMSKTEVDTAARKPDEDTVDDDAGEPVPKAQEDETKTEVEEAETKSEEEAAAANMVDGASNDGQDNNVPTSSRTLTPQCTAEECKSKTPDKGIEDQPQSPPVKADAPTDSPPVSLSELNNQQQPAVKKAAISPELPTFHSGPIPARSAQRSRTEIHASSSLNQMAIAASAQNKLPASRLEDVLERLGRHTEASAGKRGIWYKSETGYVDMNSYSWKNMALYKDYQNHMWTGNGTIKSTCRK